MRHLGFLGLRSRRAPLAGALVVALVTASPAAKGQVVPIFPLPPVPLPLPPPTSNSGTTTSSAVSQASPTSAPSSQPSTPEPPRSAASTTPARTQADVEALNLSRRHQEWVGWQTAPADATAVGMILLGALYHDVNAILPVSALIYALAPPAIHVAHGQAGKGLASLAVRLLGPALGFAVGASFGGAAVGIPTRGLTTDEGVGIAVGAICASAFDTGILGWDRWEGSRTAAHALVYPFAF